MDFGPIVFTLHIMKLLPTTEASYLQLLPRHGSKKCLPTAVSVHYPMLCVHFDGLNAEDFIVEFVQV